LRRGTRTAVEQTIDTWSFGCVLSITATWIVLGFQGVLQYETVRKLAIQKLREQRGQNLAVSTPAADDAFHNGREVLPEVLSWHNYLRSILRKTDTATEWVLNLVEDKMLHASPSRRIRSRELSDELKHILDRAKRDGRRQEKIDESVLEALLQYDRSAPSNETEAAKAKNNEKSHQKKQSAMTVQSRANIGPTLGVAEGSIHRSVRIKKSEQLANVPLAKTANRAEILEKILDVPPLRPVLVDRPPEHPPIFLDQFDAEPEEIPEPSIARRLPSLANRDDGLWNKLKLSQTSRDSLSEEQTHVEPQPIPTQEPERYHDLHKEIVPSEVLTSPAVLGGWRAENQNIPMFQDSRPSHGDCQPRFIVTPPSVITTSPISPLAEEADKFQVPISHDTVPTSPLGETSQGKLRVEDVEEKQVVPTADPFPPSVVEIPPVLCEKYDICQVRMEIEKQAKEGRPKLTSWGMRKPKKDAYLKNFIVDRDIVSVTVDRQNRSSHDDCIVVTNSTLDFRRRQRNHNGSLVYHRIVRS
jgi:hypothetical protein